MGTILPYVLTIPLPEGCRPVAARVEIAADANGRAVLIEGCVTAGDLLSAPAVIPADEWLGYLAVTSDRVPLAPMPPAPLPGGSHDR